MGFYLRKSLSLGPFRLNFSKSGVGVSTGIKGLRFGTGPRGNYVHMGAGGLYYRTTLPDGQTRTTRVSQPVAPSPRAASPLTEIESGSVLEMSDSSSADLLKELNEKHQKTRFWPISATAGAICVWLAGVNGPHWAAYLTAVVFLLLTTYLVYLDEMRKTTVLFYDLDQAAEGTYQTLHDAFDQITSCARTWHIAARGLTDDRKRNSGASHLVSRKRITLGKKAPPYVKTNISVPCLPAGRQTLYLFPDRVLVYDDGQVGAVSCAALSIEMKRTVFIEEEGVPHDSKVVGYTWKYVNKSGGPDKRFKNNAQIPRVEYEEMHLSSATGLNEVYQLSKVGTAEGFKQALSRIATTTKEAAS